MNQSGADSTYKPTKEKIEISSASYNPMDSDYSNKINEKKDLDIHNIIGVYSDKERNEKNDPNFYIQQGYFGLDKDKIFRTVQSELLFLENDLEQIKIFNSSLEKLNESLEKTRENLVHFGDNITQTDQILNLWSNLLSQSVHNEALISNPKWEGGNKDQQELLSILRDEGHINYKPVGYNHNETFPPFSIRSETVDNKQNETFSAAPSQNEISDPISQAKWARRNKRKSLRDISSIRTQEEEESNKKSQH